jgi:hypothetical protein
MMRALLHVPNGYSIRRFRHQNPTATLAYTSYASYARSRSTEARVSQPLKDLGRAFSVEMRHKMRHTMRHKMRHKMKQGYHNKRQDETYDEKAPQDEPSHDKHRTSQKTRQDKARQSQVTATHSQDKTFTRHDNQGSPKTRQDRIRQSQDKARQDKTKK